MLEGNVDPPRVKRYEAANGPQFVDPEDVAIWTSDGLIIDFVEDKEMMIIPREQVRWVVVKA